MVVCGLHAFPAVGFAIFVGHARLDGGQARREEVAGGVPHRLAVAIEVDGRPRNDRPIVVELPDQCTRVDRLKGAHMLHAEAHGLRLLQLACPMPILDIGPIVGRNQPAVLTV